MKLSCLEVLVIEDAAAAAPLVLALQGVQRLFTALQLAGAAASDSCLSHSCEIGLVALPSNATQQWHARPRVWHAIGQLPGLKVLRITSAAVGVQMPISGLAHLSALSNLASSLQTLDIAMHCRQHEPNQVADYSALGSLSGLTSLSMPLAAVRQGLNSISSCSKLRRLELVAEDEEDEARESTLQPNELAALGQMAQLTRLQLLGAACESTSDWSFLSRLQQLQDLDLEPGLPCCAVTALAHLTCLSTLMCGWQQQQRPGLVTARCAAVRVLGVGSGVPPLCAFPGVVELLQSRAWDPSVLGSVSKCCTQLKRLTLHQLFGGSVVCSEGSLLVSAPAAARTAALSSLTALQQLSILALSVNDNAEVTAVSGLKQIRRLLLVVPLQSTCTVQGLAVCLAAMSQLQAIRLELSGSSKRSLVDADVQLLLSAVRHVPRVGILVQQQHVEGVQEVVQRAEGVLKEQGLQLAAKAVVEAIGQAASSD
jgi:hypothetical protein